MHLNVLLATSCPGKNIHLPKGEIANTMRSISVVYLEIVWFSMQLANLSWFTTCATQNHRNHYPNIHYFKDCYMHINFQVERSGMRETFYTNNMSRKYLGSFLKQIFS